MDNILLLLKGSYIFVPLIMGIVLGLTAAYDKIMNKDLTVNTYAVYLLASGLIAFMSVYINTLPELIVTEEILQGLPTF